MTAGSQHPSGGATKANPAKAGDAKPRGYRTRPRVTPVEPPNDFTRPLEIAVLLRPAVLVLASVALATACTDSMPSAPEAVGMPMLSLSAGVGATHSLAPGEAVLVSESLPKNNSGRGQRTRWSSSEPNIASVTPNGVVTAHTLGSAVVTATNGRHSQDVTILVQRPEATVADSATTPADSATTPADTTTPADSSVTADSLPNAAPPADTTTPPVALPAPISGGVAELPRAYVDVSMPAVTGRTINVPAGGNIQEAIDAAQPGDEIVLQPGATYIGNLLLPNKAGAGWITIRSGGSLPPAGTRVTPNDAAQMPKLVAQFPPISVISTQAGAHHYRLIGLEITTPPGADVVYSLVSLGEGDNRVQTTLASIPHHLVLDRVYVHGTPTLDFQRCVSLNSAETAIVDSWISECHGRNMESHAIGGWNGPGPYNITNNHIAGAGINLLLGGATPGIAGLIPSDIELRRNHFTKPAAWKGVWTVKNLLELKSAQRVLAEGNVFEGNWADAQTGFALVWKSAGYPGAEHNVVQDVTFRYNIVRNSPAGLNLAARPDGPAQPAQRIHLSNNLFTNIGDYAGSSIGRMIMLLDDLRDVTIESNTLLHNGTATHLLILDGSASGSNLVFRNNVATRGNFGVFGSGSSEGTASLTQYWGSAWSFAGNVLVGGDLSRYPAGNVGVGSIGEIGFPNAGGGDYRIGAGSPAMTAGVGGTRAGADAEAVERYTAGVVR
jgi:hypothetical protein